MIDGLYPTLVSLLEWFQAHADQTGLLYGLPYVNWVDQGATDMRGANFETNALYYKALLGMSEHRHGYLWKTC